jgi:hypothetical protein
LRAPICNNCKEGMHRGFLLAQGPVLKAPWAAAAE